MPRPAHRWHVAPVAHPDTLRPWLRRDVVAAVYHLGDLDPRQLPHTRWWVACAPGGTIGAVLLLYDAFDVPAVLPLGTPAAIGALLDAAPVRRARGTRSVVQVPAAARPVVAERATIEHDHPLVRMTLHRRDHVAAPRDLSRVVPLTPQDAQALRRLLVHSPDAFFTPEQLMHGRAYGVWHQGELVAAAGTHVLNPHEGVAVVGNVVTHPAWRNRGLATRCTARLVAALLEQVEQVALNVGRTNAAARRVYARLGFRPHLEAHDLRCRWRA